MVRTGSRDRSPNDPTRSGRRGPHHVRGGWCQTGSASGRRCAPPRGVLGCRHAQHQELSNPASLRGGRLAALPSKPLDTRHLGVLAPAAGRV